MPYRFLTLITVALAALPATPARADLIEVDQPFPIAILPLCENPQSYTTIEEFRGHKLMLHLFASW